MKMDRSCDVVTAARPLWAVERFCRIVWVGAESDAKSAAYVMLTLAGRRPPLRLVEVNPELIKPINPRWLTVHGPLAEAGAERFRAVARGWGKIPRRIRHRKQLVVVDRTVFAAVYAASA